jgi:hypothetical protein
MGGMETVLVGTIVYFVIGIIACCGFGMYVSQHSDPDKKH